MGPAGSRVAGQFTASTEESIALRLEISGRLGSTKQTSWLLRTFSPQPKKALHGGNLARVGKQRPLSSPVGASPQVVAITCASAHALRPCHPILALRQIR